jgi:hypothetical protein
MWTRTGSSTLDLIAQGVAVRSRLPAGRGDVSANRRNRAYDLRPPQPVAPALWLRNALLAAQFGLHVTDVWLG